MKKTVTIFSTVLIAVLTLMTVVGPASATTIGNNIINRPSLDGATNIAFIDPTLDFPTYGTLNSFTIYANAQSNDTFGLQIYRNAGGIADWELVYQDLYVAGSPFTGSTTFDTDPFNIEPGDVVGWWFGTGGGVIPYTVTGSDDVEWTNYLSVGITGPVVGDIYSFDTGLWSLSSQKREYSISADYTVPEPTTMLLLGFGLFGLVGVSRKFKK